MTTFNVHTKQTASPEAAQLLAAAEKAYGFVPNLLATFAESPATLKGYVTLGEIFGESSFSPTEQQTVLLAASRYNECHYCLAAHSTIAKMQNVATNVVDAIRDERPIADARLESLRQFTEAVIDKRGWLSEDEVDTFIAAGFTKAQAFEVILGAALKTISNYINHIAETPIDDAFAANARHATSDRAAG